VSIKSFIIRAGLGVGRYSSGEFMSREAYILLECGHNLELITGLAITTGSKKVADLHQPRPWQFELRYRSTILYCSQKRAT